jgi:hypothetical protein
MIVYYDDPIHLKKYIAEKRNVPFIENVSESAHIGIIHVDYLDDISHLIMQSEDLFGEPEQLVMDISDLLDSELLLLPTQKHILYIRSLLDHTLPTKKLEAELSKNSQDVIVLKGFDNQTASQLIEVYTLHQSIDLATQVKKRIISLAHTYQEVVHILDMYINSNCNEDIFAWFDSQVTTPLFQLSFPKPMGPWIEVEEDMYQMNLALASTKAKKHSRNKTIQNILIATDQRMKTDPYHQSWWLYGLWCISEIA